MSEPITVSSLAVLIPILYLIDKMDRIKIIGRAIREPNNSITYKNVRANPMQVATANPIRTNG